MQSKFLFILMLMLAIPGLTCLSGEDSENGKIAKIDSALEYLIDMQKNIKAIHPLLGRFHPIAIFDNNQLYIFDYDSILHKYNYIKTAPTPFPLPKNIMASFPLSSYIYRPCCIVTPEIFGSKNGYVTIFHEFIHCNQYLTCEQGLKQNLKIAQKAAEENNYSWEIDHPFSYNDSLFTIYYTKFIDAINKNDDDAILNYRRKLKEYLDPIDFEYMTWQEWKESFARFIENRIQSHLLLEENNYGRQEPYNRITFYYGGAKFIDYLIRNENNLSDNLVLLYKRIFNDEPIH